MSNVLLEYMKKRFMPDHEHHARKHTKPGPVVTISRQYGCPAKKLAGNLVAALDRIEAENFTKQSWQWIGKEVLVESAKELNLNPKMVTEVVHKEDMGLVDDIVMSLSHKYYPGDKKIKKKMGEVIRSFAQQGHVIIVGRGGVSIARDIEQSLHIRLMAPLEWRINQVSKTHMVSLEEAEKRIRQVDKKRELIREFFEGRKVDDTAFDVIFNYATLDEDEIIATIIRMMELKDMI